MNYNQAILIAQKVIEELKPHCYKIAIAGSVRRKKAEVKDIEIVCVPKPYEVGLFESGIAKVVNQWHAVKGHFPCKYTQRILPEGIKLDLFMVEQGNWGLQYAIRTGPANFSHEVLATGWVKRGFRCNEGYLYKNGKAIGVLEEVDLFKLIGIPYVQPENRV